MAHIKQPYVDHDSLPAYNAMRNRAERAEAEVERLRERVADLEDERDGLMDELRRAESEGYVSAATVRMEGDCG